MTILAPRQAGKTTLAQETLKDFSYCNLESPENREFAKFDRPVILDEIQRVPEFLSYIQNAIFEAINSETEKGRSSKIAVRPANDWVITSRSCNW